jgi:hypothetical protein
MVVTFCSLSCVCFVVCYAQNQPRVPTAIKFDEYVYTNIEDQRVHTRRFAEALKRHPKARAYIIGYGDPLFRYGDYNPLRIADKAKESLEYRLQEGRSSWSLNEWDWVVTVDGGYRERETVELYIVPPRARPPKPTPTVPISDVTFCPSITLRSPEYVWRTDRPLTFSASVEYVNQNVTPTYHWTVSEGQIIKGQGTRQIEVKLPEGNYRSVSATLEVGEFSPKCSTKESVTSPAALLAMPHKVDESSGGWEDAMARLDWFALEMENNPNLIGVLIVYGGQRRRFNELRQWSDCLEGYLVNRRGVDATRIVMINGGYRENLTFELWVTEDKNHLPNPEPHIKPKDVRFKDSKIKWCDL